MIEFKEKRWSKQSRRKVYQMKGLPKDLPQLVSAAVMSTYHEVDES